MRIRPVDLDRSRPGSAALPIYEYSCGNCGKRFELLVLKGVEPTCPSCGGTDLERLISLPSVRSETTKSLALKAAKKRDGKLGDERVREQIEYQESHD